MWEPIETAPKEGIIVCFAPGWDDISLCRWKTNRRIVDAHTQGVEFQYAESYFGDPVEWDDYDMALPGGGPTIWHPLSPLPIP